MYLGKFFICSCIVSHCCSYCALQVFDKCLLGIFSLVWTSMSTKFWGLSCFLIRNMFGSLVVYLTHLAPHVHSPCFGHALHIATSCTHLCFACLALVYILFPHPQHVMFYFILCSILFLILYLLFELHFLIHLVPFMHHYPR